MNTRSRKKVVVAVSGGFDPVHIGHVRMFKAARELGDELVVILNNDNWLRDKKGFVFMPQKERAEILKELSCVDRVVISRHKPQDADRTVAKDLARVRPNIFANGGDANVGAPSEIAVCETYGINQRWHLGGGKIQSSSSLTKASAEALAKRKKKQ